MDWLPNARDIAILVLAVINVVVLLLVAIMLLVVVIVMRTQFGPLVQSLRKTANTVEGTASYLSEATAAPVVKVASVMAAAGKFVGVFTGRSRGKKRK